MVPTSEATNNAEMPRQPSMGWAGRIVRLCTIITSAIYVYIIGLFLSEPSENWFVGIWSFIVDFEERLKNLSLSA
jgi:hypothetical protein